MSGRIVASIAGGSGYGGGELIRLLSAHPHVQIGQITSESHTGEFVHSVHPNLRPTGGRQPHRFTSLSELAPCDVLFLALPHGETQRRIAQLAAIAPRIIDLSADFRISDPDLYRRTYGSDHAASEFLPQFAYGLPEINREAVREARFVSGVGCNATAANLALLPLVRAGLLRTDVPIVVDVKAGSSEGGATHSAASHHPERAGAVRSFAPTGHRHEAEVRQALGRQDIYLSVTSIEPRGAGHRTRVGQFRSQRQRPLAGIPVGLRAGALRANRPRARGRLQAPRAQAVGRNQPSRRGVGS